ncbi:MAG TPA: sigma-70 family RNA polymerase sigma factor [Vicinamibacterales bacterium]|nr:sigma-70 family RNA polymerase sigma factor [Vicinamibacterales bacterium]
MSDLTEREHRYSVGAELFSRLVDQYQDAGFAYAQSILGDRAAAEDATQAAFLAAWLHFRELRDKAAFGAWFRKIVRTECVRLLRQGRPAASLDVLAGSDEPRHDTSGILELRLVLLKGIAALAEHERSVISLKYLSELSYAETAEFLEVPVSTVKKRLHDARRKLRSWLDSHAGDLSGRELLKELRPSTHAILKERIMTFTEFLEVIASGDLPRVQAALDDHPDFLGAEDAVPQFSSVSANALTVAGVCGRTDVVRLLLARGALAAVSATSISPLAYTAIEGRSEIVQILMDAGAEPDIFAAAALGDADTVQQLLTADHAVAMERTPDGRTPLHFARSVPVAELLLRHGADIHATDSYGQTAVEWTAATGRHKDVVAHLVARGAKVGSADIFSACASGNTEAVRAFLDSDPDIVRARRAAGKGVPASSVGFTPLHEAAARGEQRIATLLLNSGADVNAVGGQNQIAALHAAAAGGHLGMVELLLNAGADAGIRDGGMDSTAEAWAEFFGHQQIAEFLRIRKT